MFTHQHDRGRDRHCHGRRPWPAGCRPRRWQCQDGIWGSEAGCGGLRHRAAPISSGGPARRAPSSEHPRAVQLLSVAAPVVRKIMHLRWNHQLGPVGIGDRLRPLATAGWRRAS
jgi:hypothetical protein